MFSQGLCAATLDIEFYTHRLGTQSAHDFGLANSRGSASQHGLQTQVNHCYGFAGVSESGYLGRQACTMQPPKKQEQDATGAIEDERCIDLELFGFRLMSLLSLPTAIKRQHKQGAEQQRREKIIDHAWSLASEISRPALSISTAMHAGCRIGLYT